METETHIMHQDILRLRGDIELIKNILISEGELSNWAKKAVKKARKEPEEEYTSLSEL
jgi:hypothetical protein